MLRERWDSLPRVNNKPLPWESTMIQYQKSGKWEQGEKNCLPHKKPKKKAFVQGRLRPIIYEQKEVKIIGHIFSQFCLCLGLFVLFSPCI